MKGIILKDLYENFRIFKNGVSYLAAVLFLFLRDCNKFCVN